MSVKIKEINLKNVGPITQLSMPLGQFNLVYGRNENGKTFIVEFILKALFGGDRTWHLREHAGQGKVVVQLADDSLSEFSPGSTVKLSDFWADFDETLPPDFSRLLVVKGAEVELANTPGGIDKAVIKRLLSEREMLERMQDRISKTIQDSSMQSGFIQGPRRGEIKERTDLKERLDALNRLFEQIDKGYSSGRKEILEKKRSQLNDEHNELLRAKFHLAYRLSTEVDELRKQYARIDFSKITELKTSVQLYRQKYAELRNKVKQQAAAVKKSTHFEWLQAADKSYESILAQEAVKPNMIFPVLSAVLLIAAGVLVYLKLDLYAFAAIAAGMLSGGWYIWLFRRYLDRARYDDALEDLRDNYQSRFDEVLLSKEDISARLQEMQEDFGKAKLLADQLAGDELALSELKRQIALEVSHLIGEQADQESWSEILLNLETDAADLAELIKEKEIALIQLNVDEAKYLADDPGRGFDKQKILHIEDELQQVGQQLADEEQRLNSLKGLICQETEDDFGVDWDVIIKHLRDKRAGIAQQFRAVTAEIIGKMAVNEILEQLKQKEDEFINRALQSDEVKAPLYHLTQRYSSMDFDGDSLLVGDSYNQFSLAQLSSGAREQVLLALRIGFAARLLKQERFFLILDDAFQYSDWQRRELLVAKVAELARNGWQIIYFTMDDHIRELFDAAGKKFGEEYRSYELQIDAETGDQKQLGLF